MMDRLENLLVWYKSVDNILGQRALPADLLREISEVNPQAAGGTFHVETLDTGACCVVNERGTAVVSVRGCTLFDNQFAEALMEAGR